MANNYSNSYQFNPRYQAGNRLPTPDNVLDFTPYILNDGGHKKNYLMYQGSWLKLNITPDDDLRVNRLGVGLQDSDEILYDITLKDTGQFSHTSYAPGNYKFDGSGFLIDYNNSFTDKSYAVLDNLVVRNTMTVYDFLVMQKRFNAGSLAVSPGGGKVASVSGTTITFEDPSALGLCSFAANDILISKRVAPDKTTVLRSVEAIVSSVSGNSVVVAYTTGVFQAGDEVVCVGNTTDVNRQGLIYISADDSGAPFLDVDAGVNSLAAWASTNKVQVRLGNLAGYTSSVFGALSGYGMFVKDNIYIEKGYIALGSGGYIRAGKTSYVDTTAGFWIGNDGGTPKIHIGDASSQLTWNGSVLSITGGLAGNKTYRSISTSPPATPAENDLWYQTDTGLMKQWDGDSWEAATDATLSALTTGVSLSAGGIVLGTAAVIRSGQTDYNTGTGWWLGVASSTPKFSIGNGTTKAFTYDGTDIAFVGGSVSIGSANNIFKADTNGIYLGNATFASAPFRVTMAGALTATSATITGTVTITNPSTFNNGGKLNTTDLNNDAGWTTDALAATKILTFFQATAPSTSNPEGSLWYESDRLNTIWRLEGGAWVEKVGVGTGIGTYIDVTGIYTSSIAANQITAGTGVINALSVLTTLTLGSAATDGYIQTYGWNGTVPGIQIKGGTTPSVSVIGGGFVAGSGNDVAILSTVDATYRLWIGNASSGSAAFKVTKAGALTATSATITGAIQSGSTITGATITGGTIQTATSGQRVIISGSNNDIRFYDSGGNEQTRLGLINGSSYGVRTKSSDGVFSYLSSDDGTIGGAFGSNQAYLATYPNATASLSNAIIVAIDETGRYLSFLSNEDVLKLSGGISIAGGVSPSTFKFIVNSSGQLTKVNNLAASSYTNRFLISDGTSYTPTAMTSSHVTTALGFTPVTNARTLTINGTGYDLSANRSWTVTTDVTADYAWTGTHTETKTTSASYYHTIDNQSSGTAAVSGFYAKSYQSGFQEGIALQSISSGFSDATVAGWGRITTDGRLNGLILNAYTGKLISMRINNTEYGKVDANGLTASNLISSGTVKTALNVTWDLGAANVVSPTSPNRTLTVKVGGTTYYVAAKTTND